MAFWWKNDYGSLGVPKNEPTRHFYGPIDLCIDNFLVKCLCLQTKWYKNGLWHIMLISTSCAFSRLDFQALCAILGVRAMEAEFSLGCPGWGLPAWYHLDWLGNQTKQYTVYTPTVPKKKPCLFSYSIKNTHSPFQFEYQHQSIIVFFHITTLCLLVDGGWKSFERLSGLSFLDLFGCHTGVRKGRAIHSFSTTLPHTGSAVVTPKHVHKGWLFAGISTKETVVEPSISVSRVHWIETGFCAKSKCLSRFVSTRHHFGVN